MKVEALKLYIMKGADARNYTQDELEVLRDTGLFYGVSAGRRVSLKRAKSVELIMPRSDLRNFVRIVEEDGEFYIEVDGEREKLDYDYLPLLTRMKLYPLDRINLIRWISRRYGVDIPERADIAGQDKYGNILIVAGDGSKYVITGPDSMYVQVPVTIRGAKFWVETDAKALKETIDSAIKIINTLLGGDFKLVNNNANRITSTMYREGLHVTVTSVFASPPGILYVVYREPGIMTVSITSLNKNRTYSVINKIVTGKKPTSILWQDTVLELDNVDVSDAIKLTSKALRLYKNTVPIKLAGRRPEEVAKQIDEAVNTGKLPVFEFKNMVMVSIEEAVTAVNAWLYLNVRGSDKAKHLINKYYKDFIAELYYYHARNTSRVKDYARSIGATKILRSLEQNRELADISW